MEKQQKQKIIIVMLFFLAGIAGTAFMYFKYLKDTPKIPTEKLIPNTSSHIQKIDSIVGKTNYRK